MNEHEPMPRTSANEHGFTLVEVGIVMLIVVILGAIAIPTFFGAKNGAQRSEFIGVARSYAGALEAYRLDHGGQVPAMNTPAWPAPLANGPINTMPGLPVSKQRYLRSGAPDSIKRGTDSISSAATGRTRHIQYLRSADGTSYSLVVTTGKERCSLGSEQPGMKACP